MSWLTQLFSRRRIYGDLSAEIQEHLDEGIEELIAEGVPKQDAAAAARREFGNATLIEEDSREVWRWRSIAKRNSIYSSGAIRRNVDAHTFGRQQLDLGAAC